MQHIPLWRKAIYTLFAPLYIFVWMIFHPKLVWQQAKKEWPLPSSCNQDCYQGRRCDCGSKSNGNST
jgi:hypothetical protein